MLPTHADEIRRRAEARWAEIQGFLPDLAPAIELQRRLVGLLIEASAGLTDPPPRSLSSEAIAEKWRRGVPALRNEPVTIPEGLAALVAPLCTALADGGAGDAALHIRDAVAHAHIDARSLLSVSLARNHKAIRTSALHLGFSPDLVWLVGELASSPLAHHLQQLSLPLPPESDPRSWDKGYCPFCGSWPVLIESISGTRQLRCSFCALGWTLSGRACLYCGNAGEDFVSAAPDIGHADRRVELCASCGGYTKVIDVCESTQFPLLAIEDLASMDLDGAAMERGYRRPELVDLDGIEPLKPTC